MTLLWHVLYVKPKTEKKVAAWSELLNVQYYLPLREEAKVYQRRKVLVEKPIFPGYIFIQLDPDSKRDLHKTGNILKMIEPQDENRLVFELEQIRKALEVDPALESCKPLQRGHAVKITGGPFQGVEGVVWSLKKNGSVRLNVDMIGQAVAVDIEREYLELMD